MAAPPFSLLHSPPPLLVVISGPSGVGKDAALARLRDLKRPWHFVVTATTRPQRAAETDGVDYIFIPPERFNEMESKGEFLENAEVYGYQYGVPRQQVRDAFAREQDVMMKVDVQGAATIRRLAPDAVFIFLAPGSMGELRSRLEQRRTELKSDLERRIETALKEMDSISQFDYCVFNRDRRLDEAVAYIDAIVMAERCRIPLRRVSI